MSKKTPSGFSKNLMMKDRRKLTFHFDIIYSTGKKKFLVSAFDKETRITFFQMHKDGENWKIINAPKVNDDFLQLEPLLASAIKLHEQEHGEKGSALQ